MTLPQGITLSSRLASMGLLLHPEMGKSISDIVTSALEVFGEDTKKLIIGSISKKFALSDGEVLVRLDVMEKYLVSALGTTGEVLINEIKEKILSENPDIDGVNLSTAEIVNKIVQRDVLDFVRKLPSHEHIAYFYTSEDSKGLITSAFLSKSSKSAKAAIISNPIVSSESSIQTTRYANILNPSDKSASMKRLGNWIGSMKKSDTAQMHGLRLLGEDDSWFMNNGFSEEILNLERSLGPHLDEDMSVMCSYDLASLADEHLATIINSHSYLVTDRPIMLYSHSNKRDGGR